MLAQNRKERREFMKYNKPFSANSASLRETKKEKHLAQRRRDAEKKRKETGIFCGRTKKHARAESLRTQEIYEI